MLSQQIRRSFLHYFKNQGHAIVPSSPVIPHDDPSLLFINAGMNQFKDVFLGRSKRDYTRATSSQKCIRVGGKHNDLDNVGHTSRHLTFFEMLGNFSFGDYFKKEAIHFAWDVVSQIFGFDPEKIWVSVYQDDDEAFALWEKYIPSKRIVRFGEKENFWSMGDTGPCGPCSELLYDRGPSYGEAKNPYEDLSGERYLEFWNLVFMQFEKNEQGKMAPLPKQSIDTGSGLERVVSLKLGVENVFQTDILRSLIEQTEIISGKKYHPENRVLAPAFHVIADHIRSLAFSIADGVQPSNTDRGYVLRKILRRAVRYGKMLGLNRPFLAEVLPRLTDLMGEDFPEIKTGQSRIQEILTKEEEAFFRTLQRGGNILSQVIDLSRKETKKISGEDAFKLKDTYGFPLEEILLIAKDEDLTVDEARFRTLEEEAKEKSRKAHKTVGQTFAPNFFQDFAKQGHLPLFDGYEKIELEGTILGIVMNGEFVQKIEEGQEGLLLLNKTPFYAEMGGQVGDTGQIGQGTKLFDVYDTISPFPGIIAHVGKMEKGYFHLNDPAFAKVDAQRRKEIQNNHTATHLLHWALNQVLGSHIKQAGSLVDSHRIRFDFSHHKSISLEELRQIEDLVNEKIRENAQVKTYEVSYSEAQKRGDIKQFFGEKYGEKVRVVDIDFSKELCGGTHVQNVGTIGLFKIQKESSIAAGVRRLEALTGREAEKFVQAEEDLLHSLASQVKTNVAALPEKWAAILEENKKLEMELKSYRKQEMKRWIDKCLESTERLGTIAFIGAEIEILPEDLSSFAEELLEKLKSGVLALGVRSKEKCQLLTAVSSDLVKKNIYAQMLIKEAAPLIQGGGGGKQTMAQAGGKNPLGLPDAIDKIRQLLKDAS